MKLVIVAVMASVVLSVTRDWQEKNKASTDTKTKKKMENHKYVGMWVTGDGHIRQELLPNNRYDEARGDKKSAYRGQYEVKGTYIYYWDDTGFEADGTFTDDNTLSHGGYTFHREMKK